MQPIGPSSVVRALFCVAALGVSLLAGCGQSPERLRQEAVAAEKAAREARAGNDAKAARWAADRAGKAATQLRKLAEADKSGSEELRRKVGEAQAAARSAQAYAESAEEEHERRKMLGGLKAKAYQAARGLLFTTLVPQIALAAETAGKRGTNGMSAIERPLAEQAWNLASLVGGRSALPDGRPDWAGAAADLRRWSTNQPMEFRAFLGVAFVMMGRTDFALAELEAAAVPAVTETNARTIYHGGRTLLYASQGWNHLAAAEAENLGPYLTLSNGPVNGRLLVAILHGTMACEAGSKRDLVKMDAEIAQCIRAWPENPLLGFLTGEKLAANGEWEKAAESLEARAAGSGDEWLAGRLAQRARELRDGKGSTKGFVMDAWFLVQFAAHCAVTEGTNSAAAKKLAAAVAEAGVFGRNLFRASSTDRLPVGGPQP
jgi:hypothetical protein